MSTAATVAALHAAGVCELAWLQPGARPDIAAATPLVLDGRPAFAFPYAYAELGRAVGAAEQVAVVLSDPRSAGSESSWRPIAVLGRPRLTEDRDGDVFIERLLDQELRKFPPSRTLADSPILRREHWWYVPRLIVTVEPDAVVDVHPRVGGAADGVLAVAMAGNNTAQTRLALASVDVERRAGPTVRLRGHGFTSGFSPGTSTARAALLCHDFSADIERWASWTAHGTLTATNELTFGVEHEVGDVRLPPPLGLLARLRRQRDLARACQREF